MKPEQKILTMILQNSESLFGIEYDCSIKDVIDYGIEAYIKEEIYDPKTDEIIGTKEEKAEALAQYFEILANKLRTDYKSK